LIVYRVEFSVELSSEDWSRVMDSLRFRAFDLLQRSNEIQTDAVYASVVYDEHVNLASLADFIELALPQK
jgi:hypothetical protein